MKFNEIKSGNVCVISNSVNNKKFVCLVTENNHLIDVDSGIYAIFEDLKEVFDCNGCHTLFSKNKLYVSEVYSSMLGYHVGETPIWKTAPPKAKTYKAGEVVKIRKDLVAGLAYGKLSCSQITAFFGGEEVTILDTNSVGFYKASYKGSKPFIISQEMIEEK